MGDVAMKKYRELLNHRMGEARVNQLRGALGEALKHWPDGVAPQARAEAWKAYTGTAITDADMSDVSMNYDETITIRDASGSLTY